MDSYLSKRTVPVSTKKSSKNKHSEEDEFHKEADDYYKGDTSFMSNIKKMIPGKSSRSKQKYEDYEESDYDDSNEESDEEYDEMDDRDYEEYSEKRYSKGPGVFSIIKKWFYSDGSELIMKEEVSEPEVPDDIKDILKLQNRWIAKLSPKKLEEFKKSEDYKIYKETLERYDLIKKK